MTITPNWDKIPRELYPPVKLAEMLSETDALTDKIWDLRGDVLVLLKVIGKLKEEDAGPENQGLIDNVIRHLLETV